MAKARLSIIRNFASALRIATRSGGPSMTTRLAALPRMARAVARGEYHGTSLGRLALMVAAVGYVVSPVDLVPEGLFLALGLVDDAMVLSWLAAGIIESTEDFLAWEGARVPPSDADTVRAHVV